MFVRMWCIIVLFDCSYDTNGFNLLEIDSCKLKLYHKHYLNYHVFCRSQYIFYVIHSIFLTIALVLAARKTDPSSYDEGIDIFRGICEALLLLSIFYNLLVEIYQLKR